MFKQVKSNRLEKSQLCGKGDCLIQKHYVEKFPATLNRDGTKLVMLIWVEARCSL